MSDYQPALTISLETDRQDKAFVTVLCISKAKCIFSLRTVMDKSYLITLREEELEQMILRCVRQVISEQVSVVQKVDQSRIGGIDLACEITQLAKPTIYGMVNKRRIPHRKMGGRLYFKETELIDWIDSFKRKTADELDQEAEQHIQERLQRYTRRNKR